MTAVCKTRHDRVGVSAHNPGTVAGVSARTFKLACAEKRVAHSTKNRNHEAKAHRQLNRLLRKENNQEHGTESRMFRTSLQLTPGKAPKIFSSTTKDHTNKTHTTNWTETISMHPVWTNLPLWLGLDSYWLTLKIWCKLQTDPLGHFGSRAFGAGNFKSTAVQKSRTAWSCLSRCSCVPSKLKKGCPLRVQTTERLPTLPAQPFREQRQFCTNERRAFRTKSHTTHQKENEGQRLNNSWARLGTPTRGSMRLKSRK